MFAARVFRRGDLSDAGPSAAARTGGHPLLEQHRDDDDDAFRDGLGGDRQVVQGEHIGQRGEDQHAEDRPDDGAPTSGQQRPADDHSGNRVQFVQGSGVNDPAVVRAMIITAAMPAERPTSP